MKYNEFTRIMSTPRMDRYLGACNNDTRKAMTLYRKNLKLSQELFTVISCFEVALRNAIDSHYYTIYGNQWLRIFAEPNGLFDTRQTRKSREAINDTIAKLRHQYTHSKLVSELGFGFWRYLFGKHQYRIAGRTLINIFPNLPATSQQTNYNAKFIFNELEKVNIIRNRIAHHDPVCFRRGHQEISTNFVKSRYDLIIKLFNWMNINESELLYGLNKVDKVIDDINNI